MFGILVSAETLAPPASAQATLPECQTPTCVEAAKTIKEYVDFNVDPCDDFYKYACGSWSKSHSALPNDRGSIGTLDSVNDENINALSALYEGDYDGIFTEISWDTSSFHTTNPDQVQIDRQNFNKIQSYYKQCMDTNAIDAQGATPVYPLLAKILAAIPNQVDTESLTAARIELTNQATANFFSTAIEPDDKQPDQYTIKISQPDLTLPKGYYSNPDALKVYHQAMVDVLTVALGTDNTDALAELRSQKAAEAKLKLLSVEEIKAMADHVIEIEKYLASISMDPEDLQDPLAQYNPKSISELQSKYPFINWDKYIGVLVEEGVALPESIIDQTPVYFEALTSWLTFSHDQQEPEAPSKTTTTTTTTATSYPDIQGLKDYFFVKTLLRWNYALDTASRNAWKPVSTKLLSGTTEFHPRERICVSYADNALGMIQGRFFVMKKFGCDKERTELEATINTVHETLLNLLAGSTWLDKPTLAAAIDKANKIKAKVAYNIVSPDERLPETLQEYYSTLTISDNSYIDTELSYVAWVRRRSRQKIGHPVNKEEWSMTPDTVNAYYDLIYNQIVILAGISQTPIYTSDAPDYLKYGALGFLVGHELTHAFDSSGRQYSGDGKLENWWSPETEKHYEELTQCFIHQYNNFTFEGPDKKVVHLNGKLSLTENIADNGGLAVSYEAFQQVWHGGPLANGQQVKQEKLPGIDLTPEQLFFVNYGILWCGARQPESAVVLATTDTHALEQYRVIGVAQNSANFAKAFQCPVGSPMNPKEKCSIW